MARPRLCEAFTSEEAVEVKRLLAQKVVSMGFRKFEEDDWAQVYCQAVGIEDSGWSNLDIDIRRIGLGVEQKMLKVKERPSSLCGQTKMHPSATRSVRVPAPTVDADEAAADVLRQYGELIEARRLSLDTREGDGPAQMRTGWLLWAEDLSEFVYFEEELKAPNPSDFRAEWVERKAGGARKPTTNLWIFEKESGEKRFSVTGSDGGSKIQPYFDIPPMGSGGLYVFCIQGCDSGARSLTTSISETTLLAVEEVLGERPSTESIGLLLSSAIESLEAAGPVQLLPEPAELAIPRETYSLMRNALPRMTDEDRVRVLLQLADRGTSSRR